MTVRLETQSCHLGASHLKSGFYPNAGVWGLWIRSTKAVLLRSARGDLVEAISTVDGQNPAGP